MELFVSESRSYEEIVKETKSFSELANKIIKYFYKGKKIPEVLYGETKLFLHSKIMLDMRRVLMAKQERFEHWKPYLKIKMKRYMQISKKNQFLKNLRKSKKNAKEILEKLIATYYHRNRFELIFKYTRKI